MQKDKEDTNILRNSSDSNTYSINKEGVYVSKKSESQFDRQKFLKKYSDLHLEEKVDLIERREPDFWANLLEIRTHYMHSLSTYKGALREMINEISEAEMNTPAIHSIRYRVKDVESLLVKIIDKSAKVPAEPQGNPEIEKYRHLTKDNYYMIITDLIGVRILIRYRYQWQAVHKLIWALYHADNHEYIRNWEADYCRNPGLKFVAEQPKAYIKLDSDRGIYEAIGKNIFHILSSDNHYASLHYIVNFGGNYAEIQVRTIFDEAWCECNHDFVYKAQVRSHNTRKTLERSSTILAQHTTASEEIVSLMCDISRPSYGKSKSRLHTEDVSEPSDKKSSEIFLSIKQRALNLSQKNNN